MDAVSPASIEHAAPADEKRISGGCRLHRRHQTMSVGDLAALYERILNHPQTGPDSEGTDQ